jgi:hypothetical protein
MKDRHGESLKEIPACVEWKAGRRILPQTGGWNEESQSHRLLVCRGDSSGVMGKIKSVAVLGWNAEEKVYKYMGYDNMGMMGSATGTATGNTWNWSGEDRMGGKLIKSKYTVVLTSPTTQTFKWETSEDGKTWATMAEGKSTKK